MEILCVVSTREIIHGFVEGRMEKVGDRTEHLSPFVKPQGEWTEKIYCQN